MSLESRQCSHQIHENFKLFWQWKGISTLAWMMSSSLAATRWNPRHASVIRAGYCQIFLPCWVGFATAFWRSVCFWWLLMGKNSENVQVSFDVPSEAVNPRPSSGQNMQVPRSSWRRWTPTQKRRGSRRATRLGRGGGRENIWTSASLHATAASRWIWNELNLCSYTPLVLASKLTSVTRHALSHQPTYHPTTCSW